MLPPVCDKITMYKHLALPFGFYLPVTLVVEKTTACETLAVERTAAQAQREGEAQLLHRLHALMAEEGSVETTRFAASRQGDYLLVTLSAECHEQIGVSVEVAAAAAPGAA